MFLGPWQTVIICKNLVASRLFWSDQKGVRYAVRSLAWPLCHSRWVQISPRKSVRKQHYIVPSNIAQTRLIHPPDRCPSGSWRRRTGGPAPAISPAPRAVRWTGWSSSWDGPWAWWATLVPLLGEPAKERSQSKGFRSCFSSPCSYIQSKLYYWHIYVR